MNKLSIAFFCLYLACILTSSEALSTKKANRKVKKERIFVNDPNGPCTEENLALGKYVHEYPGDPNRYIQCVGEPDSYYIRKCSKDMIFGLKQKTCIDEVNDVLPPARSNNQDSVSNDNETETTTVTPPIDPTNPCNPSNLARGRIYHVYPRNVHKFIQCAKTPGSFYIQKCPKSLVFLPASNVCGLPPKEKAPRKNNSTTEQERKEDHGNPCNADNIGRGKFLHPYPGDIQKYIHCRSKVGEFSVKTCPREMVFLPQAYICAKSSFHINIAEKDKESLEAWLRKAENQGNILSVINSSSKN